MNLIICNYTFDCQPQKLGWLWWYRSTVSQLSVEGFTFKLIANHYIILLAESVGLEPTTVSFKVRGTTNYATTQF